MTSSSAPAACTECLAADQQRTITRRNLLKAMGVGAATGAFSLASTQVAWAENAWVGDTLVVLSLRGGFDGLTAVAPVGDPDYLNLRPSLAVPAGQALKLDARFGFHPALAPLMPLWKKGNLAVVHATGLPNPNRSHFAAMDEIERAVPGSSQRTGWLDRTLGLHTDAGPFGAVQLGSTTMPYAFSGPHQELGLSSLEEFSLSGAEAAQDRAAWTTALSALHDGADAEVRGSVDTTLGALGTAARLKDSIAPANGAAYPDTELGRAMRDAAQLIKAQVGARVITVDEGDWDMHAGMGGIGGGWMHRKLTDLAQSLAAFATDLGALMGGVTLVTMSEFGRRAQENESNGTDHGWGNAMFVLGGNVSPGVHGVWPGLHEAALEDGDLRATTDYRAVLADILSNRCGADSAAVSTVFPGWRGSPLGVTVV